MSGMAPGVGRPGLAGEQWLVPHAATHDHYLLSDDPALIDVVVWHAYLQRSYWAAGMPLELLRKACANSLCVGVYDVAGGAGVALSSSRSGLKCGSVSRPW